MLLRCIEQSQINTWEKEANSKIATVLINTAQNKYLKFFYWLLQPTKYMMLQFIMFPVMS
jgi:hypothetical protein